MSPVPSHSRVPKRPWYLVAALVAGWVLGANAMSDGCNVLAFYKGEAVDVAASADAITDAAERDNVIALEGRKLATMDAAKNRLLPVAIASLLLGAAMVMFAARAMSGRPGSRGGLVQVTLARAAIVVLGYFMVADVRAAEVDFIRARTLAIQRQENPDKRAVEQIENLTRASWKFLPPMQLFLSSLASALVVIALTRPRSREFFEAAAGSLPER